MRNHRPKPTSLRFIIQHMKFILSKNLVQNQALVKYCFMCVLLVSAGRLYTIIIIFNVKAFSIYRSDVHFWKHGRVGDSMVVTDEVRSSFQITYWMAVI